MALSFLFLFVLLAGLPNVLSVRWKGIGVPVTNVDAKNVISGCYIVVYNGEEVSKSLDEMVVSFEVLLTCFLLSDNATSTAIASHQAVVSKAIRKYNKRSDTKISASMKTFAINSLKGFSLKAGDGVMMDMTEWPEVGITPDYYHSIDS